jgi:integrase
MRLHGLGIDPTVSSETFSPAHIEATIAGEFSRLPASTRANETSALRKAARLLGLHSPQADVASAGRAASSTPYTATEAEALLISALHLPSARRRKELTCMVALSLGAGLSTQEISALHVGDINTGAGGATVTTSIGAIPILSTYVQALHEVLADQPEAAKIISNTSDVGIGAMNAYGISHGMTGWNIWRAVATWRVYQLSRVPLPVLARGLRLSPRYLAGLLEHCQGVDDLQLDSLSDSETA